MLVYARNKPFKNGTAIVNGYIDGCGFGTCGFETDNKTVKISKGSTVKWVWSDGQPHNVKGPGFKSSTSSSKGHTYTHKFNKKGTFTIICTKHPSVMRMTVKVIVTECSCCGNGSCG